MKHVEQAVVNVAMSYQEYRSLINRLLENNKTTGDNHSEDMLHYTTMNAVRMERLDRTTPLTGETIRAVKQVQRPMLWLILTEAWCGDAAQVIPVLQKMADQKDDIELRLLLRDDHPQLMDAFLTNGGRSIPKLIILDAHTLEVLGSWGPRPKDAQRIVFEGKAEMANINEEEDQKAKINELAKNLQRWYAKDKTRTTQEEVVSVMKPLPLRER